MNNHTATKTSKVFKHIATMLMMALTLLTLASSPASAQTSYVDTNTGFADVGGAVDISGGGFVPGEGVAIDFGGWTMASTTADQNGDFYAVGWVDPTMPTGTHPLDAYGDLGSWATIDLTIVAPAAPAQQPLLPYVGTVQTSVFAGDWVDVYGGDFIPGELVDVEFGGTILGSVTVDNNGEFFIAGPVDSLMPTGSHPLDAYGDLGSFATASTYVDAALPPTQLFSAVFVLQGIIEPGELVDILGTDFVPGEFVTVEYGGMIVGTGFTDGHGDVVVSGWTDMFMPVGVHPLDAYGDMGSFATTDLEIVPLGALSPTSSPTSTGTQTPQAPVVPQTPTKSSPTPGAAGQKTSDSETAKVEVAKTQTDDNDSGDTKDKAEINDAEINDSDESTDTDDDSAREEAVETPLNTNDSGGISLVMAGLVGLILATVTAGAAALIARRET